MGLTKCERLTPAGRGPTAPFCPASAYEAQLHARAQMSSVRTGSLQTLPWRHACRLYAREMPDVYPTAMSEFCRRALMKSACEILPSPLASIPCAAIHQARARCVGTNAVDADRETAVETPRTVARMAYCGSGGVLPGQGCTPETPLLFLQRRGSAPCTLAAQQFRSSG